eukprot:TRINITY_DN39288_c0_g1_i3.p1 TRINITY_DN39288_c0_g1~~TRINITY_DN39288_c0_g1_i3.p1  ORF type:complete len:171 (-),score=7.19 TRINITY_DN39288_c0_g1_i3:223-735(-)
MHLFAQLEHHSVGPKTELPWPAPTVLVNSSARPLRSEVLQEQIALASLTVLKTTRARNWSSKPTAMWNFLSSCLHRLCLPAKHHDGDLRRDLSSRHGNDDQAFPSSAPQPDGFLKQRARVAILRTRLSKGPPGLEKLRLNLTQHISGDLSLVSSTARGSANTEPQPMDLV